MSDIVLASGTDRNLTNVVQGERLAPDATEKKYVTYLNDLGAVHTIIVDVEHAAQDAEQLLEWFHHTRAAVSVLSPSHGGPNTLSPDDVTAHADNATGLAQPSQEGQPSQGEQTQTGGGF